MYKVIINRASKIIDLNVITDVNIISEADIPSKALKKACKELKLQYGSFSWIDYSLYKQINNHWALYNYSITKQFPNITKD